MAPSTWRVSASEEPGLTPGLATFFLLPEDEVLEFRSIRGCGGVASSSVACDVQYLATASFLQNPGAMYMKEEGDQVQSPSRVRLDIVPPALLYKSTVNQDATVAVFHIVSEELPINQTRIGEKFPYSR